MPQNNNFIRDIIPAATSARPPEKPEKRKEEVKRKAIKIRPSRFKFIVSFVILYAAILATLNFFSRAEVNVVLKNEDFDVNRVLSAGSAGSEMPAEKVVFQNHAESNALTSESKDFSEKASGLVIIYNAYSSEPQILVAQTRFESTDGKIYRIAKEIVVPGAKIIDGKIEPSSLEVRVFADKAGEEYNIGLNDFSVPGFSGSLKYGKFYARSKTPMSGGFTGRANVVSENDVEALKKTMEEKLRSDLYSKMQSEIPGEFLVPEGAYQYEIKVVSVEPAIKSKADEFKLTLEGNLKAIFIRRGDIKNKILDGYKSDPDFNSIDIPNFGDLKVLAANVDFNSSALKLTVAGSAKAVWNIESPRLAEELALAAGAAERLKIFERYPQIRRAEIFYKPSWWRIFPDTADKVLISGSY
ncbi:MAG: hypothetical protein HYY55_01160 [Candidatus Niyogibacteria bacterium]|nr:MAG: hypothetical protein HYY55_01160 [Candidatus Niyogibacteria bacterium]